MIETRLLVVGPDPAIDAAVAEAAALLRAGDVVAFPTETVYGLGADATSPEAVERIYAAKNRPADNPSIVHVANASDVSDVAREWPEVAQRLAAAFWPGPLTLVVRARPEISRAVGRGLDTVAVRVPAHPIARALAARAGVPIAAPSANISGRPSPTTAAHVLRDLGGRIPLILDGGPCSVGLESTVLDLVGDPAILRPGQVTREQIERVIGRPIRAHGDEEAARRSPGTRYRHYSPSAPVVVIRAGCASETVAAWVARADMPIGYVGWRTEVATIPGVLHRYVAAGDTGALAASLYAALRELDEARTRTILCDEPIASGFGAAVAERLERAATFAFAPGDEQPRRIAGGDGEPR